MDSDPIRWVGVGFALLGVLGCIAWNFPEVKTLRPLRRVLERLPKR